MPVALRCALLCLMVTALAGCTASKPKVNPLLQLAVVEQGPMAPFAAWDGAWTTNFGNVVLYTDDDRVVGVYKYVDDRTELVGTILGKQVGNALEFQWSEQRGGAGVGRGTFRMAADGSYFTGLFGYETSADDGGAWNGTRQRDPASGR